MLGRRLDDFPHQLSGGMRQRVMIAIALSCEPKILLADEPTTAVDVTIQAQLLELINRLTKERGTAVVVITHNLGVVARYADNVNVMYAGRIVESSTAVNVYGKPRHPYTLGLLGSVPRLDESMRERLIPIEGMPPDLAHMPGGCSFRAAVPVHGGRLCGDGPGAGGDGGGSHGSMSGGCDHGQQRRGKELRV